MEVNKNGKISWMKFLKILFKAKVPWGHYLISGLLAIAIGTVAAALPNVEGQIATGDIFDMSLLTRFIVFSIIIAFSQLTGIYSLWANLLFDRRMQKFTWRNLIRLPMHAFEDMQPSSLISRITDDATIASSVIGQVISFIIAVYSALAMIVVMFQNNPKLTMITLPLFVLNAVFYFLVRKKGFEIGYSIQDSMSKLTACVSERITNLRYIKAAGMEEREAERERIVSEYRFRSQMKNVKYQMLIQSVMGITNIILLCTVLIGGAVMVNNHSISPKELIAFYIIAIELPPLMQSVLFEIMQLKKLQGSVNIMVGLCDLPNEDQGKGEVLKDLKESISFRNVSFRYTDEGRNIINKLSFDIPAGKVTAIVGPSGSGKTTLLKLLERFYNPSSGEILYDGLPIEKFSMDEWRSRFGYIVQNSPLITGTIRSNILYGAKREFTDDELVEIAKKAQIYDFISSQEKGFDTEIYANGMNLSGGQRQRIAIARALAAEPEIMIMDEATSNLDVENMQNVNEELRKTLRGKTIIVVAHQLCTIRDADQIIVLSNGELEISGSHAELCCVDSYYGRSAKLQNA